MRRVAENDHSIVDVVRIALQHTTFHYIALVSDCIQWRRQRSKGARSFRGQKILQPGHPDALFSSKKVDDLFSVVALKIQAANAVSPSK